MAEIINGNPQMGQQDPIDITGGQEITMTTEFAQQFERAINIAQYINVWRDENGFIHIVGGGRHIVSDGLFFKIENNMVTIYHSDNTRTYYQEVNGHLVIVDSNILNN